MMLPIEACIRPPVFNNIASAVPAAVRWGAVFYEAPHCHQKKKDFLDVELQSTTRLKPQASNSWLRWLTSRAAVAGTDGWTLF
jgi:hypothetical protein